MTQPPDDAALMARASTAAAIRSAEVELIVKYINRMSEEMDDAMTRFEMVMVAADIALGRHRAALEPSDKGVGR